MSELHIFTYTNHVISSFCDRICFDDVYPFVEIDFNHNQNVKDGISKLFCIMLSSMTSL